MIKSLTALALCAGTALLADNRLPARVSPAESVLLARPAPPRQAPQPQRYGLLWLDVVPGDAQVSLDGEFLDVDVWLISMAPGQHHVSIRKDGFRPVSRLIGIGPGQSLRLAVSLEKDTLSIGMGAVPD